MALGDNEFATPVLEVPLFKGANSQEEDRRTES